MRAFGTPLIDYAPALAAAAAASLYLATAYGYSPDARAAPLLIGWSVIVLAALDAASRTQTAVGGILTRWLNPVGTGRREGVAAFALIGALYAIPLYVFAATRWRGQRPWLACALSAAVTLAGVWLLFAKLLRLELYPGLLFGGL
jgi:hypothetical protein